jgi:hypothetical protein
MIASVSDLVAFLKRFHRRWLDDPSIDPALIPADLPEGLATIYRELGALVEINQGRSPFSAQDTLAPLSRLKRVDGMIEFAYENQGNWAARCPVGLADPPVYSDVGYLYDAIQRGFVVVCESLNHFLTTLCLHEAVMGCRNLVSIRTDRLLDRVLTIPAQPLWLNGYYVYGEPNYQFFVSPDPDVLILDSGNVWVDSPVRQIWVGSLVHKLRGLIAKDVDCTVIY